MEHAENFEAVEQAAAAIEKDSGVVDATPPPEQPGPGRPGPQMDTSDQLEFLDQVATSNEAFEANDLADIIEVASESYLKHYPQLQLTRNECNRLSAAWVKVVNKWLDKDFKYKDELLCAVVTMVVIGPRYRVLKDVRRNSQLHRREDQAGENSADGGVNKTEN